MKFIVKHLLAFLMLLKAIGLYGQTVLPPEQAFPYEARISGNLLEINFYLPEGYYLYKDKFGIIQSGNDLGYDILFPEAVMHEDEFFGISEIYRDAFSLRVNLDNYSSSDTLQILLQGCADIGLCYPPQVWTLSNIQNFSPLNASSNFFSTDDPLSYEDAFQLNIRFDGPNLMIVNWLIEPGYYMYSHLININIEGPIQMGALELPEGIPYFDEYFGSVDIYRNFLEVGVPFSRSSPESFTINVITQTQGCKDEGICYPPTEQVFNILVPSVTDFKMGQMSEPIFESEQSRLASLINNGAIGYVIISFFIIGILLAFTPCVLPMIPILSGLIFKGKESNSNLILLAISFVLGMSFTYTMLGLVAGIAGSQIQTLLQSSWFGFGFAAIYFLLGLSMINGANFLVPNSLNNLINNQMSKLKGGSYTSTMVMGILSGLTVTACVVPPLVGALIAIGESGNIVRGGVSLFVMSLGMGLPLLLIGLSADRLLPRVGPWMENIKGFIGLLLIATSIYLIGRSVSIEIQQMLWAILILFIALELSSYTHIVFNFQGRILVRRVLASLAALYGSAIIFSTFNGAIGIFPNQLWLTSNTNNIEQLNFNNVDSFNGLQNLISEAQSSPNPIMIEVTADWCVSCRELERYTFTDQRVIDALDDWTLLKTDVTEFSQEHRLILDYLDSYGPPTIIFFDNQGQRRDELTLIGFVNANDFIEHIELLF